MDAEKRISEVTKQIDELFEQGRQLLKTKVQTSDYKKSNMFYADDFIMNCFDGEEIENLVKELQALEEKQAQEDKDALNREYERSQL